MRTFDPTLKTDADVKRIAEWAMPDKFLCEKAWSISNSECNMLHERAGVLPILLWSCTPENEPYGLKLAQAYSGRVHKYWRATNSSMIPQNLLWIIIDEFMPPKFPSALRDTYPEAYYDDETHPAILQREIDWYQRWYPRRDYCRKISDILYG